MLKVRIIPRLLVQQAVKPKGIVHNVVITKGFKVRRKVGSLISQARIFESQYADEIMVILKGDIFDWSEYVRAIGSLSSLLATPLTIGGNIADCKMAEDLFRSGADKVAIGRFARRNPNLISEVAERFGNQAVVGCIDVKRSDGMIEGFENESPREGLCTGVGEAVKAACQLAEYGVGEICITSVDRDGSSLGYDVELIQEVSRSTRVPIIAGGGCGVAKDFTEVLGCGASAVSAATYFAERDQSVMQARAQMENDGFKVRQTRGITNV